MLTVMLTQNLSNDLATAEIYLAEPYHVILKVKGDGKIYLSKSEAEQLAKYPNAGVEVLEVEREEGAEYL